jgi:hypothetical protein
MMFNNQETASQNGSVAIKILMEIIVSWVQLRCERIKLLEDRHVSRIFMLSFPKRVL